MEDDFELEVDPEKCKRFTEKHGLDMREGEWQKKRDDDDERKGGVEQDDDDGDDKTVEEGRVPKGLHNPQEVSKEERDEHNRTRIPF